MDNKTKIVLTVVGLAAIVVPTMLLLFFTRNAAPGGADTSIPAGSRQINKGAIEKEVQSNIQQSVVAPPSPTPSPIASATPAASKSPTPPLESTTSGH